MKINFDVYSAARHTRSYLRRYIQSRPERKESSLNE